MRREITIQEIMEEWQREFPMLTEYSERKIYQRVGPVMLGLYFFKDITGYSPKNVYSDGKKGEIYWAYNLYMSVEPLWYANTESSGMGAFIDRIGRNISFREHSDVFTSKVGMVKDKYGNILSRKVDMTDFVNMLEDVLDYNHRYQEYNMNRKLITPVFLYNVASILELELGISTYIGNEEWTKDIWRKIDNYVVSKCAPDVLLTEDLTVEEWLRNLHAVVADRTELMKCVERNSLRPEVARLHVGEFTGIDKFKPDLSIANNCDKSWKDKVNSFFKSMLRVCSNLNRI